MRWISTHFVSLKNRLTRIGFVPVLTKLWSILIEHMLTSSSIQMEFIRKFPPTTSCMLKGITAGAYCIRSMRHILLVNHLTSGKRRSKAHILYSPQIVYSKPALCNEIRLFRAVSTRQHKDPDSPEAAEGFSQILVRVPEEKMR